MVTHGYDVDGNRVRTEVTPPAGPATVTNLLVDPFRQLSHVVAETDSAGNVIAYYVRGAVDLLAVMRTTQTRFYHADGLGSIRFLTDDAGNVSDSYEYTAFGELLAHTGTDPQPYGFAREPFDPVVQVGYHRARWMDTRTGRFMVTDPHPGSIEEPLTLHRYLYSAADPVNNTDPSGLFFSLSVSLAAIGISTTINTISLPIAEAMISTTASLELVPIWVRDRRWDGKTQMLGPFPGWPAEDMQAQLGQARSVWGRAGVVIHTGAERGPILVDDSNIPRDQPASGQRIEEFIRAAGIRSVRANQVPVVFIRTIGGTSRKGRAFVGSLREPASIGMPIGASELSLAHEVGHVLGLDHHVFPWNLMFSVAIGGGDLTERQAAAAREGVRIRSGGR